jgi:ABC-type multidrug transport system fused ATPase/permease subunit
MTVRMAVKSALALLTQRDRRLLLLSIAIQMATSALDLLGVLLIGLVGALSVTTIQSQPAPSVVRSIADTLGLESLSDQQLVVAFAAAAAAVLLVKSLLSSILTRRVFMFLANRQALVSARLCAALLSKPLTFVQKRASQETAFALIYGAGAATMSILGLLTVAATEVALLVVLGIALLFISPWVALASIVFFGLVALTLQRAMGNWAARVGAAASRADIASLNAIQEALSAYREISVSNRRSQYVERIQELRWQAAKVAADTQFIGMLPKYMFEAALVLGGFALAAALFTTQDSVTAVGTLALFLAAGTRVMPSLLRLQGAALGLRGAAGAAAPTFELADDIGDLPPTLERAPAAEDVRQRLMSGHPDFVPTIRLEKVAVIYPGSSTRAVDDASLEVADGKSLALVGRSGAGKSTMADVILGVLEPSSGVALLGSIPPADAVKRWPGAVAYVPQDIVLANDSVRANVALGLPREAVDDGMVWEALERAHFADFLRQSREGLDTHIGERGVRLSGGQRQRLGIARALYTRPRLLVLDEATSALDAETEMAITETIQDLGGDVTTVIIAHRLSTVRNVDVIVYMEDGRIVASGPFDAVRRMVPSLDRQASLMGLS